MKKFQPGQKVVRIKRDYEDFQECVLVGDVVTVIEHRSDGHVSVKECKTALSEIWLEDATIYNSPLMKALR